jgi:hypothetical protein
MNESDSIIKIFTSRIHTIMLPKSSTSTTTFHSSTTGSNLSHKNAGIPNTTSGPSRASVVFWAGYIIILCAILLGYIGFTIYLLGREYPKGRKQRRLRTARAAQAAKEAGSSGEDNDSFSSTNNPTPRLIHASSKRAHSASRSAYAGRAGRTTRGGQEYEEHGEIYEMDDLGKVKENSREEWYSTTSATPAERLKNAGEAHKKIIRTQWGRRSWYLVLPGRTQY